MDATKHNPALKVGDLCCQSRAVPFLTASTDGYQFVALCDKCHSWGKPYAKASYDHETGGYMEMPLAECLKGAQSVVPEKYRLKLNPRHLSAGFLDVYDILELTGVEDKELDHAAKKILCSGRRGKGSKRQDVTEAIVALQRYLERHEEIFEKDEERPAPLPSERAFWEGLAVAEGEALKILERKAPWTVMPKEELLASETPLCNHGINKESCDRCWESQQLAAAKPVEVSLK